MLEQVARNEYTAPEDRDPTVCSLYYFALRKKRLVQGLWKQATFHKERGVMLKFLMNDFDEPRWKSAALKNAFALMGKQRFRKLGLVTLRRFSILTEHLRCSQSSLLRACHPNQTTPPLSFCWETVSRTA